MHIIVVIFFLVLAQSCTASPILIGDTKGTFANPDVKMNEDGTLTITAAYAAKIGGISVAGSKGLATNGKHIAAGSSDAATAGKMGAALGAGYASDGEGNSALDIAGALVLGDFTKKLDAGYKEGDASKASADAHALANPDGDGSTAAAATVAKAGQTSVDTQGATSSKNP